jgi:hypothetical protein
MVTNGRAMEAQLETDEEPNSTTGLAIENYQLAEIPPPIEEEARLPYALTMDANEYNDLFENFCIQASVRLVDARSGVALLHHWLTNILNKLEYVTFEEVPLPGNEMNGLEEKLSVLFEPDPRWCAVSLCIGIWVVRTCDDICIWRCVGCEGTPPLFERHYSPGMLEETDGPEVLATYVRRLYAKVVSAYPYFGVSKDTLCHSLYSMCYMSHYKIEYNRLLELDAERRQNMTPDELANADVSYRAAIERMGARELLLPE